MAVVEYYPGDESHNDRGRGGVGGYNEYCIRTESHRHVLSSTCFIGMARNRPHDFAAYYDGQRRGTRASNTNLDRAMFCLDFDAHPFEKRSW
jgi:hypothetical protein